jgi:hypothetical protein
VRCAAYPSWIWKHLATKSLPKKTKQTLAFLLHGYGLDFAGAWLDAPPNFTEETWIEWEADKREQFDDRWPKVQKIINAMEEFDIHMVDVSPSNIAFPD